MSYYPQQHQQHNATSTNFQYEQHQLPRNADQDDVGYHYHGTYNEYHPRSIGNFHGARNVSLRGNVVNANRDYINITNNQSDDTSILMRLADAACLEAGHEIVKDVDRPKCHEDTRKAVIADVMSWIDSDNPDEKLMWLKGPAGAGKSSIAQSICIRCRDEGKLISSFFFSRAVGGGRADGTKLIATIAYQLMQAIPEAKKYLVEELVNNPAMLAYTAHATELQFEKLVLEPLARALSDIQHKKPKSSVPHLLVVDGLDECNNVQLQSKIITLFATALAPPHVNIKCFIASRPELEIRNTFSQDDVSQRTTEIVLDDNYNPDEDIRTYFMGEFSAIKRSHTLSSRLRQVPNWPAEVDVKELVRRASGQFIYAVTVIKYIKDPRHSPIKRLQEIIRIRPGQESQYKELDALYRHILNSAVENAEGYENILPVFQIMLHQVDDNLLSTIYEMASFLDVSEDEILLKVVDLHSLMFVPIDYSNDIKFFHTSFADYLKDAWRSKKFYVDEKAAHRFLAHYCLLRALGAQDVRSNVHSLTFYPHVGYLSHFARSDFDDALLEELFSRNRGDLQILVDHFIMQYVLDPDFAYDKIEDLHVFFSQDSTTEFASPRTEKIRPLCECISNAMNDLIITELCADEIQHIKSIALLEETDPQRPFYDSWKKEVLTCPIRGKRFYLSSERCQHIWRRLWKLLQSPKSEDVLSNGVGLYELPGFLEYLLDNIEPSAQFRSFLIRFTETFETVFELSSKSPHIYDEWESLRSSISDYIDECENADVTDGLNLSNIENNAIDGIEDVPITSGVQPPWIITKNESGHQENGNLKIFNNLRSLPHLRELLLILLFGVNPDSLR